MNINNHLSDLVCPCCGKLKNANGTCPNGCDIVVNPLDIPIEIEGVEE